MLQVRPAPLPLQEEERLPVQGQRRRRRLQHRQGGDGGEEQDQLVSRVICDRVGLFPLNANNYDLPGKMFASINKRDYRYLLSFITSTT